MYRRWMTQFKESVLLSERNADFGKSYEVLIRGVADLLIVHAFSYKCLTPISDSKLMSYHYTITHYQQKQVNLWRELDLAHSMYEFLHHKVWRARKITYSFGLSGKWWLYLEGSPLQLSCFPYYLLYQTGMRGVRRLGIPHSTIALTRQTPIAGCQVQYSEKVVLLRHNFAKKGNGFR